MDNQGYYRAFEDRHRGSRALITDRLKVYLPFVKPIKNLYMEGPILDLGCGRGEWLELMVQEGFNSKGIDLDEGMLNACHSRGLSVELKDVMSELREWDDGSVAVVSGFHLAEHLPFHVLQDLVKESLRILKPAGLLILETPNPDNIVVATRNFYLDPTHQRPLPQQLLSFLVEYYGFARVKILGLQEVKALKGNFSPTLNDVLGGASPDYAVIAQKVAGSEVMALFDHGFDQEYGMTTSELAARYDASIQTRLDRLETKLVSKLISRIARFFVRR